MRLQRLEISGFKSFPDRAELAFDQGVTAIVGPNGCGKSNVVDAITWVLGEQSAKSLRGDRMEDVIFAGSDARKPTGAAEVKLRLAGVATSVPAGMKRVVRAHGSYGYAVTERHGNGNGDGAASARGPREAPEGSAGEAGAADPSMSSGSPRASSRGERERAGVGPREQEKMRTAAVGFPDLDERPRFVRDIEIGRRLYRSGESEYLIDGEICRLRDIHDLLMDAGVGVKAYAVIEQGKIGQILSARPTDRRQLIEEAAGVTKYKTRRRAAELKLEAAQQNLTRVEDIIFEVERQRGALKRQAAKARRYQRLRDELRRWEKVQFAARYRMLAASIEAARSRLAEARGCERAAAAGLAEAEATVARLRLELAEADAGATRAREAAHARELEIGRLQQQAEFDRRQVETLAAAAADLAVEIRALEGRRGPARAELDERRAALAEAERARDDATAALGGDEAAYAAAHAGIEGLDSDVEAARSEVFSAMNAATALRHAVEHAGAARERAREELARLDVERHDLDIEARRAAAERQEAERALTTSRATLEATSLDRAKAESALAAGRTEADRLDREGRAREQEIAAVSGRLQSLEELDAGRAEYGDAARHVLASGSGVPHLGSVADYLEVERGWERAVEACLGDLLQYVLVRSPQDAAAALRVVRQADVGRCGFLIVEGGASPAPPAVDAAPSGVTPLASLVRITGPYAGAVGDAIGAAWVAESVEAAAAASRMTRLPTATREGEVFRGPHLVSGGAREQARGILATKNEIKDLRQRLAVEREGAARARGSADELALTIAATESAIETLVEEQHRQEKAIVEFDLRLAQAVEEAERVARKQEQVGLEHKRADDERQSLEAREVEARESIRRLEAEQREADERFAAAQRRLFAAREALDALARRVAERKAEHAALVERAAAIASDVRRVEEASAELEARLAGRSEERRRNEERRRVLQAAIADTHRTLDEAARSFDALKEDVRVADERSAALRVDTERDEAQIREARRSLEDIRADVSRLEVARATAESDLGHLASACAEAVQASLDEVAAEVAEMEARGTVRPVDEPEADSDEDTLTAEGSRSNADVPTTPEDAVAQLKQKIDRLGPVNMMAIDQFDELEARHTFLTTQRKDLVDAIAQTTEAIRRIDKTTRERFKEAFEVINQHFQGTFSTLFGGGRATLVLLDESDQLESGIDVIAQPPGKRLQNLQLLSGGEKALTAMALMFAIFKYRPSPFCLLDEIDAPLDDANIGRFVEMLQGMQTHTQFILITHNRKTMEIADRLYGVTMEEPGVSKLISVQLN
jgi:chromosome segregation protein